MLAAKTTVPVLGVPVPSKHLQGVDSLHSIVQMPKGIPVATFAIGTAGAANAALFAVAMLAREVPGLHEKLQAYRQQQTEVARGSLHGTHDRTGRIHQRAIPVEDDQIETLSHSFSPRHRAAR